MIQETSHGDNFAMSHVRPCLEMENVKVNPKQFSPSLFQSSSSLSRCGLTRFCSHTWKIVQIAVNLTSPLQSEMHTGLFIAQIGLRGGGGEGRGREKDTCERAPSRFQLRFSHSKNQSGFLSQPRVIFFESYAQSELQTRYNFAITSYRDRRKGFS